MFIVEFSGVLFIISKPDYEVSVSCSIVFTLDGFSHYIPDFGEVTIGLNKMLVNLEEILARVHD